MFEILNKHLIGQICLWKSILCQISLQSLGLICLNEILSMDLRLQWNFRQPEINILYLSNYWKRIEKGRVKLKFYLAIAFFTVSLQLFLSLLCLSLCIIYFISVFFVICNPFLGWTLQIILRTNSLPVYKI